MRLCVFRWLALVALSGWMGVAAGAVARQWGDEIEGVRWLAAERERVAEIADADTRVQANSAYMAARRAGVEADAWSVLHGLAYGEAKREGSLYWFWSNHFSVFSGKGFMPALMRDYFHGVGQNASGEFTRALEYVLRSPAMLQYLDNTRSRGGAINENFARELLELHTLGVHGGYTQNDVIALARVLTGVGLTPVARIGDPPPRGVEGFIRDGLFQFDPRRHDDGTKVVLGHVIQPGGWDEIEQVIDLLGRHPSTAQHISRKLVTYMVADEPPPHLVESTAAVFRNTDGDLRAVVDHVLASPECTSQPMTKLKSSWEYVVSVLQTTYPDAPPADPKPVLNGLNRLGQPLFGRSTPDGYSLKGADWLTPALLLTRIEFARQMVGLAKRDGQLPKALPAYWMNRVGVDTRRQIGLANSLVERFVLLLSSPEFMLRESCLPGVTVH